MNIGRTVFSQLMDLLPHTEFRRCVALYRGDFNIQTFSCLDQFLCMAFAQLSYRESLRDIEACLRAVGPRLYHMGFRGTVSRNTLAHANQRRDWRIYADFAQVLIGQARALYAHEPFAADLDQTVYALDSTTIDLCLALFPWAPFQRSKAAVKLHTLLDLHGNIPTVVHITHGRISDVSQLDQLLLEPGAFYILDRGYVHFQRLYQFTLAASFFVIRARKNMQYRRRYSHTVDKTTGLRSDQTVMLTGDDSSTDYPVPLRRVSFRDELHNRSLVFLTNNFLLPSLTVAQLYKARWQVELFFKWIKQHLRIKAFYGRSANAVKTQVWIALSVYVLLAILKKQNGLDLSLYTITQILSLTMFEKTPILQALQPSSTRPNMPLSSNQLILFD
jgi:Transposase DDE domain/Domain of unknown function (DUF4372)